MKYRYWTQISGDLVEVDSLSKAVSIAEKLKAVRVIVTQSDGTRQVKLLEMELGGGRFGAWLDTIIGTPFEINGQQVV